jgi:hypothetical protein
MCLDLLSAIHFETVAGVSQPERPLSVHFGVRGQGNADAMAFKDRSEEFLGGLNRGSSATRSEFWSRINQRRRFKEPPTVEARRKLADHRRLRSRPCDPDHIGYLTELIK